jgi:uncharacterized hydrophobic protein (TIGR00271 family)
VFDTNVKINTLLKRADTEIRPDEDLVLLSIFGSILATFGLYLGNEYVLIGSMLVAPFMDPIVSMAVFLFVGKWEKFRRSVLSLFIIIAISLVCAASLWMVLSLGNDVSQISTQMHFSIEYFYVGLVLGAVGMFLWMWPKSSNTSAGISIAISLIPPLADLGRSLVILDPELIRKDLLSFSGNFLALVAGAMFALLFKFKILKKNKK